MVEGKTIGSAFVGADIGRVQIGNVPAGQSGTHNVTVQTFVPCSANSPTTLPFNGAITYSGQ
jgi:hypothetical protein